MKIISWNINGYRAVWKKGFAEWLEKENPDIICLQETKAWSEQLTEEQLSPLGYHSVFSKPSRKGYSGVATFSKNKPDSSQVGFGEEKFDAEGRVVITEQNGFFLANIYFPNGQMNKDRLKYKMDFYDKTLKYFGDMRAEGKKIVVCGDYNTAHKPIDLARPKQNEKTSGFLPEERAWIDKWIESGFVDVFRIFNQNPEEYSWWAMRTRARDRNVGWRIDYHFVSSEFVPKVKNAWISQDVMGSDHCPLGIELDL